MIRLTNNALFRLLPGNPIFVRVVEAAAKRTRHALIRIGYLGVLMAVTLILIMAGLAGGGTLTELAKGSANLFMVISFVQLGMACLMAPIFTAGAITQEKDNQTYNVLLATPLSNAQIVLGSLLSRLFFVLTLLAAGIPMFLITQLFGGVPGSSILLSFMIAAATAAFTGAVAVAIAVIRIGAGKTVFAFYIVISLYLAIIWVLADVPAFAAPGGAGVETSWLTALHPFLSMMVVLNIHHPPSPAMLTDAGWLTRLWLCSPHYAYLCWTLGAGAIMVAMGAVLVRFSNARTRIDWGRRLRLWLGGGVETRKPRTVWRNPVAWREAVTRASAGGKSVMRWLFMLGGLAGGAVMLWTYGSGRISVDASRDLLRSVLWVEYTIVLLVLCNVAASAITREREDGTLDLLLVTPITSRYYIWGKLRGLISFAAILLIVPIGTAAMYAVHDLLSPPAAIHIGSRMRLLVLPLMPIEGVATLAMSMLGFCGVTVVTSLTMSLKARRTVGAVIGTVAVVGATVVGAGAFGAVSADNIPFIGPVIAMASPYVASSVLIYPHQITGDLLIEAPSFMQFRLSLVLSAVIAAGIYGLIVFSAYKSMVGTFDMIIRKQSR